MIFDIILVLLFIITLIIGYKVGFLTKFIKLASGLCGFIFALVFCGTFANFLCFAGLNKPVEKNIYNNIIASEAFAKFNDSEQTKEGLTVFFNELGLPDFLAKIVGNELSEVINPIDIAHTISNKLAYVVMLIISFIFLWIGTTIVFFFLKKFIKVLRQGIPLFRIVDGILGVVFYALLFFIILYILLMILSLLLQINSIDGAIGEFVRDQLKLSKNEFGLTKYFYENNMIGNLLKIFF